jgi:hypothetical protein
VQVSAGLGGIQGFRIQGLRIQGFIIQGLRIQGIGVQGLGFGVVYCRGMAQVGVAAAVAGVLTAATVDGADWVVMEGWTE